MEETFELSEEEIVGTVKDRVVINVGGSRHECYISTIQNFPDTRLYWIAETALKMADFDPDGNEFFFDRHPGCFQNILNYCRTGKLHCPNDVCGPLFEEELQFWGVSELMMEPCCWGYYTQHREASKNLQIIDELFHAGNNVMQKKEINSSINQIKFKIWMLLDNPQDSFAAQIIAMVTILMIVASLITFCLYTMPSFKSYRHEFDQIEIFYCFFFTMDFLLRIICCPCRRLFFKNILTWIDFCSTLQFYLGFIIQTDSLDFLSMFRLLRCFRLIRFFKDLTGMLVIGQTLKASAKELLLLGMIFFVPMIIFSTMVYYAEKTVTGNQFTSIPASFWWAIITLSTVGYGDVTPKTVLGKFIGAACSYIGVLMVALPISVIGNNFSVYYSYAQARMRLPKRADNFLLSADKALLNVASEKNMEPLDNPDEESSPDNEFENPKRSRRHAIRNSFGPISLLQKKQKEFLSANLPLIKTDDDVNNENDVNDESDNVNEDITINNNNKQIPSLSLNDNNVKNNLLPNKDMFERNRRSVTITNDVNKIVSQSQEKLNEENIYSKKRVLHLDISRYQPQKLTLQNYEQRRRKSHCYLSSQSLLRDEQCFSVNDQQHENLSKQRKYSALRGRHSKGDLLVCLENDSNILKGSNI